MVQTNVKIMLIAKMIIDENNKKNKNSNFRIITKNFDGYVFAPKRGRQNSTFDQLSVAVLCFTWPKWIRQSGQQEYSKVEKNSLMKYRWAHGVSKQPRPQLQVKLELPQ